MQRRNLGEVRRVIISPHVMLEKALRLEETGKPAEATAAYEALLEEWPDLPDAWYNLARLQKALGHYEAALASYNEALQRNAHSPEEVHLNRGVIFADHLRRDEDAERALTAALILNPTYVPALLNLANLFEDRGNRARARELYAAALAVEPGNSLALARLAGVSKASDAADPLIARLRAAVSRPGLPPTDKADLCFALGRLLDQARAYTSAFAAYSTANRAAREVTTATNPSARYNRARHEAFIGKIIAAFSSNGSAAAPVQEPPVFICGMFRSGSTLAEQVLAAHPRITAGGELDIIPQLVATRLQPFPEAMAKCDTATLAGFAQDYHARLAALFAGADLVTDKRPDNYLYIGLIKAMFPTARIIHTVRQPLDTCLSVYFQHLSEDYGCDLGDIGHTFQQYRRLMAHWKALYADDIFDFDYDAFVAEPKPALERLLAFLGLDFDERCLSFHAQESSVKTASVWQVREPLYQKSSGRWRAYESELSALKKQLAGLL